ncbi:hypothetical protein C8Q75DRAFT_735276 [Abortiporus biennis]|nr:hypothetical protein C8Q75DRAFT_735276 [Abortiporus biennis]
MYTTLAFLTKKPGLTTEEFISYYEEHHIPLINRLTGPENQPIVYKRRYTHRDDPKRVMVRAQVDEGGQPVAGERNGDNKLTEDKGNVDFDVITELVFEDEAAQQRWMGALLKNWDTVVEDEERFLWRERTRAVVASQFASFDG